MDRALVRFGLCAIVLTASAAAQSGTVPLFSGSTYSGPSVITQSGGNVGIGVPSPGQKLTVNGTIGILPGYSTGRIQHMNDATSDYLSITNNWNMTGPTTGSADNANLGTAQILSSAQSGTTGTVSFIVGPPNTIPSKIMTLQWGGVGIGTEVPDAALHVVGTRSNAIGVDTAISKIGGDDVFIYSGALYGSPNWGTWLQSMTESEYPVQFLINPLGGNVGIGTTAPGAKLEVNGNIALTRNSGGAITFQDGTTQTTAYLGTTCGADYAESVDVTGDRTNYAPGDVLVIDPKAPGQFLKSNEAYSTMVAGIYSTKPGYVGRLREANDPASANEIPMAMLGRVPTKVSAENGPIQVGDLLVTSSTLGYAMKGTDRSRLTGAVIGKALGSLDSGTGTIMVLVTLQ